jgi:hypothetical protein
LVVVLVLACLVMICGGCRRVDRWHLSGRVTYGGQPVQEGHISFDTLAPGPGKGGAFAKILNGAFDTQTQGRQHCGGQHRVTISAYKGLKDSSNPDSPVVLLFPPYQVEADLPMKAATMDFDVPADWK